jgi:type II secretory pathway component PulC
MFGKKALSPEEKLLRIIEHPKPKVDAGIPLKKDVSAAQSLVKLRDSITGFNFLDLSNRFLVGIAVISTAFFIFIFLRPSPLMKTRFPGQRLKIEMQEASDISLLSRDEYLQTIIERNMFNVIGPEGERPAPIQRVEQLDLKLVGIITIDKDSFQAIIEDKDGRTYLGGPNETILGSITIEKIEPDKVVLRQNDKIIELK